MIHSYVKGDVIDVNLGNPPTEIKGHEQAKTRPCVVIKSFDSLGLVVVVPCTSKMPKYSLFTQVSLPKGSGGLTSDSYALCHQIRTVSHKRIVSIRGRLDHTNILRIHGVLIDILEL